MQKLLYLIPHGKQIVLPQLVDQIESISEISRAVATQSCAVKREGDWKKGTLIKYFSWYWKFLQIVFSHGHLHHSKILPDHFLASLVAMTKTTSTSS